MPAEVFATYADYYDLLYADKDYAGEAAYVAGRIRALQPQARRVLDLGCGTGRHAQAMAGLDFTVVGADRSEAMLERAQLRRQAAAPAVAERLAFVPGDVRTLRSGDRFDAVTSLFHVMSYQLDEDDLLAAFTTAALHLAPGGVFVFDVWHGAAVLADPPSVRIKRLVQGDLKLTRISEPTLRVAENRVDVRYELFVERPPGVLAAHFVEVHPVRYWFLPELRRLLAASGFTVVVAEEWMSGAPVSTGSWSLAIVAQRTH